MVVMTPRFSFPTTNAPLTRRQLLKLAGAGTSAVVFASCGGEEEPRTVSANATGTSGCTTTPMQAAGPFAADIGEERIDITDGQVGSLLELNFTVLGSGDCLPLTGAEVVLWHANAQGVYSGFADQGEFDTTSENFLRGSQRSDGNGTVRFTTIYPGWYPGRTTHLHIQVTPAEGEAVTTQLYFPDNISNAIYTRHEAYEDRGAKDTTNDADGQGADLAPLRMNVIEANTGHFASHTIGLDL